MPTAGYGGGQPVRPRPDSFGCAGAAGSLRDDAPDNPSCRDFRFRRQSVAEPGGLGSKLELPGIVADDADIGLVKATISLCFDLQDKPDLGAGGPLQFRDN